MAAVVKEKTRAFWDLEYLRANTVMGWASFVALVFGAVVWIYDRWNAKALKDGKDGINGKDGMVEPPARKARKARFGRLVKTVFPVPRANAGVAAGVTSGPFPAVVLVAMLALPPPALLPPPA